MFGVGYIFNVFIYLFIHLFILVLVMVRCATFRYCHKHAIRIK